MVRCMKTTLIIADPLMQQLREKAAAKRRTLSGLEEEAIRNLLQHSLEPAKLRPLPRYPMGAKVDVANREELYRVMEED